MSNMRDAAGRFVAEPLRNGCNFCMMHTVLFPREPVPAPISIVVAYIDLETDSLDVISGKIVEIGTLVDGSHAMFSTVVHPGYDAHLDDVSVHGIPHEELQRGPNFAEAFTRLEQFLQYAALSVLDSDDDSEDGRSPAVMKQDVEVCVVAHNGAKFDFPFMLQECLRAGIVPASMLSWVYVDTLDVLRATDRAGECAKLQCALRVCCGSPTLRAHRALDDCVALEAVVRHVSASLGIKPCELLRPFAFRLDGASAVAQMNALIA